MGSRKRLFLKDKLNIVDDYKKGKCVSTLCVKYGLAKSTISTILKSKENLLKNAEMTNYGSKNRKSIKDGEFPRMETKLFLWFQKQRRRHIQVTGSILQHKAKEFHKRYYSGNFNASHGWLTRFKKRYGVRLLKLSGEKLSSRADYVDPFKSQLRQIIREQNLNNHAVFNADETGLFWKMLPEKTYVHSGEKSAPGRKLSKERITLLLCCMQVAQKK